MFDNATENNRAMFGGGRYDNLVGLFVKNAKISGVGYGMGDVTLENFSVLIRLSESIEGFKYDTFKLARGGDMMFTDTSGKAIATEFKV